MCTSILHNITSVLLKISVNSVMEKICDQEEKRKGKSSNFALNFHHFSVQNTTNALSSHIKVNKFTNTPLISTHPYFLRRENSDTRPIKFTFRLRFTVCSLLSICTIHSYRFYHKLYLSHVLFFKFLPLVFLREKKKFLCTVFICILLEIWLFRPIL